MISDYVYNNNNISLLYFNYYLEIINFICVYLLLLL